MYRRQVTALVPKGEGPTFRAPPARGPAVKRTAFRELLAATAAEHDWTILRDPNGEPPMRATAWVLEHPSDRRRVWLEFSGAGNVTRARLQTDVQEICIPFGGRTTAERHGEALRWLRLCSRDTWRDELERAARIVLDTLASTPPEKARAVLAEVTAICGNLLTEAQRVVNDRPERAELP